MKCPECQTELKMVDFYDCEAYHCPEHLFQRILADGTVQECLMSLDDGCLRWKTPCTPDVHDILNQRETS